MNVWILLVVSVTAKVKGDDFYQPPAARYSVQVPPVPVGYSSHPIGYTSHPIGYTSHHVPPVPVGYSSHPIGFTSHTIDYANHPVGYTTSAHQTPITVYAMPQPYFTPSNHLSVVHGPFLAAGPTMFSTPHAITTYSVREPEITPCRSHIHTPPPTNTNTPNTSSPQKPPPQVVTPTPPPQSGINAHYKVPNPLSLINSFAPPSVHAYHGTNSKDHPSSSQNLFSIGISTPKFDDVPFVH